MNIRMGTVHVLIWSFLALSMQAGPTSIPETEFQDILHTLKTYDLPNADKAGYDYYLSLIMYVEDHGSKEQQEKLQRTFQEEPEAPPVTQEQSLDTTVETIKETLDADVISPELWRTVVHKIAIIEEKGSVIQQNEIRQLIETDAVQNTIKNLIFSTMQSIDVKDVLKTITIGTVYGVLPGLALKAAAVLSGNLDIVTAGTALIDIGVLSALDGLVRYATQRTSELTSASLAGAASIATQDFLGYAGPRPTGIPLMGPIGRPLLGLIQTAGMTLFKQKLDQEGISSILTSMDWRDVALGPKEGTIVEQSSAFMLIKEKLNAVIQNETVRGAIATTLTYAAEGALMGAVMHTLGVGFYDESGIATAMAQSMIRGALEGLYTFSVYKEKPVGAAQRTLGGFAARSLQQVIRGGTPGIGLLAITPIVVQQVSSSVVNSVVRTTGGWGNLMGKIFRKQK
jgi:hypothetical protein